MQINKVSVASFAICGALIASAAIAQDKMDKMEHGKMAGAMDHKMAPMDHKFVMDAASGGMAEVAIGKLATEKGSSQAVKDAGQKLVDDHTKANDELKSLASAKSMTLPTSPTPKEQAMVDKMSSMSGAEFDKAFVSGMLADHKKDIAMFTKESTSGKDAEVKDFATKTLPTLKEHAKMIMDINAKKM